MIVPVFTNLQMEENIMSQAWEQQILREAWFILENKATIRQTAEALRVGKSKVHHDMRKYLPEINSLLAQEVAKILEVNKKEFHIRGGLARKRKCELAK